MRLTGTEASDGQLLLAWLHLRDLSTTDLALNGELAHFDHEAACAHLSARMLAQGRQSPVLPWVLASNGRRGCVNADMRAQAIALLRDTQADNLAIHLLTMPSTASNGGVDSEHLDQARTATRYDTYETAFISALSRALIDSPDELRATFGIDARMPLHKAAVITAMGYQMALVETTGSTLRWLCQSKEAPPRASVEACVAMATTLATQGTSVQAREAGIDQLLELTTDAEERTRLQAQKHRLTQLNHTLISGNLTRDEHTVWMDDLIARLIEGRQSSFDALNEVLAAHDIDVTQGGAQSVGLSFDDTRSRHIESLEITAEALQKQSDPWSRYTAAMLWQLAVQSIPESNRISARQAHAKAIEQWQLAGARSDDPALLTALLLMREPALDAQRSTWLKRLRLLDPDNLLWLSFDPDSGQPRTVDALAKRIEQPVSGTHFRIYHSDIQRGITRSARTLDPDTFAHLMSLTLGEDIDALQETPAHIALLPAFNVPLPALQSWQACQPTTAYWQETRRAACTQIATTMMSHSDAVLVVMRGAGLLTQLAAGTAAEADHLLHVQDAEWRFAASIRLRSHALESGHTSMLAELHPDNPLNEVERINVTLHEAGQPLSAPEGWTPLMR